MVESHQKQPQFLRAVLFSIRQGSKELDSSSSLERSSPVMLRVAKHLATDGDRPFAARRRDMVRLVKLPRTLLHL